MQIDEKMMMKLEFLLECKVNAFRAEGYEDVSVELLKEYLLSTKWKIKPVFLHELTSDVLNLLHGEIIDYLRLETVFHAKEESLHQIFSNLI
ncbi:hypothetical protein AwErysi_06260 [Erysipelotrichaceae bacterium]|nr:hypothetical protein AwErysi_06260 [Erysipelotrichaceae bacterium]